MPQRNDLRGRLAPKWASALLTRRYGTNPFGESRYRLVWAPSRLERSGGIWVDWDAPAGRDVAERRVTRRRCEMRWIPKYPGEECWIVERWLPASAYGSREQWYAPVSQGGTVLHNRSAGGEISICSCGDYPEFGDYEDIGARMRWYPTESHLTLAIDAVERARQAQNGDLETRMRRKIAAAEQRQAERERQYELFCRDVLDDADQAFGGAPLIGYGGTRRHSSVELCERLGIREHPF